MDHGGQLSLLRIRRFPAETPLSAMRNNFRWKNKREIFLRILIVVPKTGRRWNTLLPLDRFLPGSFYRRVPEKVANRAINGGKRSISANLWDMREKVGDRRDRLAIFALFTRFATVTGFGNIEREAFEGIG